MDRLTLLDWAIFALVGYLTFTGYRRGLLFEVLSLLALGVAIYVGITFYHLIAGVLNPYFPAAGLFGSLFGVGITIFIAYRLLIFAASLASRSLKASTLGVFDRIGGGILGIAKACLIIGALAWLWVHLPGASKKVITQLSAPSKTFVQVGQWEVGRLTKAAFWAAEEGKMSL